LPTAYCLLPTADCLLLTAYFSNTNIPNSHHLRSLAPLRLRGKKKALTAKSQRRKVLIIKSFPFAYCLLLTAYADDKCQHLLRSLMLVRVDKPNRQRQDCFLPTAHCLLPIAYCLLPIAYCQLPTAYCLPLTAYFSITNNSQHQSQPCAFAPPRLMPFYLQILAYCLLPIAYCPLPTAHCLC
jgi:hypothetical protein